MNLMETPIRLVVKAPNQRVGDQTVECALNWTVQKLKNYLSEVYPSNPKTEDQKLIYSGQLLHDNLMLKDVLRQYDVNSPHIVHLVCTPNKEIMTSPNESTPSQNTSPSPPSSQSSSPSGGIQDADGVRHRNPDPESHRQPSPASQSVPHVGQPPMGFNPSFSATPSVPAFNMPPDQMAQQMLWMQHLYAQYIYYYMHMQYQNTSVTATVPPQTVAASSSLNVVQPPAAAATPVPPQQPQQQPQAPRAPNENVRMNAQGGLVDDDDEEMGANRDWLDWFYILSRVVILFSIVYFYSSLSRLLAVTLMVALFYMYQAGFFQNRRRPRHHAQPAAPPPVPPQNNEEIPNDDNNNHARQNADVNEEQMRREAQEIENMMDNDIDAHIVPVEAGPSIWNVTWSILTGFFASLIPEQPAQI